jgi:hypothetical protein
MERRILPLLPVLLVIGMLGGAEAAVLCANPGGVVFMRDTCNGNEQQLDLAALGLGGPNDAYTSSRRNISLTLTPTTVAELSVAPGSYIVQAYVFVNNNLGGTVNAPIICTIASGGAFDFGVLPLQPFVGGNNISAGTLALTSVAALPLGGSISMQCYNNVLGGGNAAINIVRLTAIRADSLTDQ